jgi:acyl carrier protein
MSDTVAEKVLAIVAKTKKLPLEKVTIDSTFEELRVDSLDGLNLCFDLEEAFNISIPDEVARNMKTVREVVEAIETLLAAESKKVGGAI